MNPDAELTVAAVQVKGWQCVRLAPLGKKPAGRHWQITKAPAQGAAWLEAGDNIGLVCGERSGVAVLDPDNLLGWADMVDTIGQPSAPWVLTGSGKLHYYIAWEPDLPAKIVWRGELVGEIQRGPGLQQVVMPPSIHPVTGQRYRWITERLGGLVEPIDPVQMPFPRLPGEWRAYLRAWTYVHR